MSNTPFLYLLLRNLRGDSRCGSKTDGVDLSLRL